MAPNRESDHVIPDGCRDGCEHEALPADGPPVEDRLLPSAMSHIVGPPLTMDSPTRGRVRRQRCLWCGALISEDDLDRMAVALPADGSEPGPISIWSPGAVVRLSGENPKVTSVVEVGLEDSLPDDACANLDHEVTA